MNSNQHKFQHVRKNCALIFPFWLLTSFLNFEPCIENLFHIWSKEIVQGVKNLIHLENHFENKLKNKPAYPRFSADQMGFIKDKQMDILHILSLFPSAGQHIPLFWGTNNHVTLQR